MEKRSCGIAVVQQFMMLLTWDMPGTAFLTLVQVITVPSGSKRLLEEGIIYMSLLLANGLFWLNACNLRLKAYYNILSLWG